MYKKRILGLAIASALTLTGCLDNNEPPDLLNEGAVTNPGTTTDVPVVAEGAVYPIFNPATGALPIPNDLIFRSDDPLTSASEADGSFDLFDSTPPVTTALNGLSGASTVAPIDIALSGLIDEASVNGSPLAGMNPNPAQNVFLLETAYASESPLQGLSLQEPPTVVPVSSDAYTAEVKTLDGRSVIRIHPKEPLKPLTRYIVAITDSVLDLEGNPIVQSPGTTGYGYLTDPTNTPASTALLPVAALINNLWEPLAEGYFNAATNVVRGALSLDPITADNIAMSYSFMTSGDEKVLDYIADPSIWISDRVKDLVRVTAAGAALDGGAGDYTAVKAVVDAAYDAWLPSSLNPALAGCDAAPAGDARYACAGTNLYTAFEAGALGFTADFPDPEASTITMNGAPTDVTVLVPSLAASIPAGAVLADQGTITIPYYSGLPVGYDSGNNATWTPTAGGAAAGTGLPLKYSSWEPDAALATTLNVAFYCSGLAIPQGQSAPALGSADQLDCANPLNPADFDIAPGSSVINYIYPFPAKQDDVTIPILAIYPNPAAVGGATSLKTMMWGHGLTGDRTNALGFGSLLVAQGVANAGATAGASLNAVIAIDEPLHGIADDTSPLRASLFNALERHFGYQDGGSGPTNPPELIAAGGSGSMFINLESFLTARDNNRQHVLDLMNVRKSLPATTLSGHTLDGNYFYSGHSLGTINSQAFVTVANDSSATNDDITAAAFFTPGGGISRFFENSPAFGSILADGLAGNGITPDTSGYQTYLNVFQAAVDSVDAINFADRFAGTTPMYYFVAANDLVIPVDQSSEDRTLQSVSGNGNTISGSVSFLSGAEPLVREAEAAQITDTAGTQAITQAVARYKPCAATHGTPSIPDGSDIPDAATYMNSVFAENLGHALGLVTTDGAAVTVSANAAALDFFQSLPLPAIILDENTGC